MLEVIITIIHKLRFHFFIFIIFSFFYYLGANPIEIGRFTGASIGSAVGITVGVPENPFNKIALQLKEKEENLNERERVLDQRETEFINVKNNNKQLYFIASGIVVLFILIILNFFFDYRRKKKYK